MKEWTEAVLSPVASLKQAIACIDKAAIQVALVLDDEGRLLGTISDGDLRRSILRGASLCSPVAEAMNTSPLAVPASTSSEEILQLMRAKSIRHVPLLDDALHVVGLVTLDELMGIECRPNHVVLMAGGQGKRLRPLTEKCPKPMLRVNGRPILEKIIQNFVDQGFSNFYLSVNYLAEQVCQHFEDGSRFVANIDYLRERKPLGTAGALSLLPQQCQEPLIVMNADLLTDVRFNRMLQFHEDCGAIATIALRQYEFQIPYGVAKIDDHGLIRIDEKPTQSFFVNAGIYVLSPEALKYVPRNKYFDMPSLFESLKEDGHSIAAYPLHERWIDIGELEQFERAQAEWA